VTATQTGSLGSISADAVSGLAPTSEEKAAVSRVLVDISGDLKTLLNQELALAKAEITAEAGKVGKGAGLLGGAGFAGYMVALFASIALWWGLANLMDQSWAALIVAALWAVIAAILFVAGRGTLKSIQLKPVRTLASLKQLPTAFTGR
jgi:putative superfamily III holin-X